MCASVHSTCSEARETDGCLPDYVSSRDGSFLALTAVDFTCCAILLASLFFLQLIFQPTVCLEIFGVGAREMVYSVKCLVCKHEDRRKPSVVLRILVMWFGWPDPLGLAA